jgi:hypothetical protein
MPLRVSNTFLLLGFQWVNAIDGCFFLGGYIIKESMEISFWVYTNSVEDEMNRILT